MKMAPIRLMALLCRARAPTINNPPVGRPLLPLDTVWSRRENVRSADDTTRRRPVSDRRRPTPPDRRAGHCAFLDASRATEEFGRMRVPAEAVGRYRRVADGAGVASAPLRDTPRKGDAKREAAATDAWLAEFR